MNAKLVFTIIALALVFIGYIPYIADIFKKKTNPHGFTFLIWTISTAVSFFLQMKGGAGLSAWITFPGIIFQLFIFLLCFKYGTRDITKSDVFFLTLALISLFLWLVAKQPIPAAIFAVLVELLAFIPTVRKSWNKPYSETIFTYWMYVVRFALSVLALSHFNILTALFPATLTVANLLFAVYLVIRRRQVPRELATP